MPRRSAGPREIALHAAQLGFAGFCGWLFATIGVPAGWLSGALIAVAILVVMRRAKPMPPMLADLALMLAGISLGASATPQALAALGRYPASLAILMAGIVAITFVSAEFLRRRPHWSREEAILASVPGALTVVLAVAADRRARLGQIVVIQMFRLLALMLIVPSLVSAVEMATGVSAVTAPPGSLNPMPVPAVIGLLVVGAAIGLLFKRLNVPAPMLFGTMAVSVAAHATGLLVGGLPPLLLNLALVLVGTFIALRMRTLNRNQVRASLPEAIIAFAIGGAIAAVFAGLVTLFVGVRFDIAFLAFAPGGLEAMIVLAIALGLDPLYVGTHHLARMLAISLVLPLAMRWRDRKEPDL